MFFSCTQQKEPLPYYGSEEVLRQDEKGEDYIDTVYKQVTGFNFIDQDSNRVTEETVAGKVYVVDFFFTSCPTICPKMKQQMLRIYEKFEANDNVVLLSHSIDIRNDTVPKLKRYAEKLEIDSRRWHMVTGTKDGVYGIAEDYILPAQEDQAAPGGYLHSGQFVLMDGDHHIRGYYDGTVPTDVDLLMQHMEWLLEEQNHQSK
jgi:protein SCO1/2